jgi:hypothetical protein
MKKIIFFLSAALIALTSCEPEDNGDYKPIQPKYVDKITHANGSVIDIEYDSDMRVKSVSYTDALNAANNRNYEIKYNLNMNNNSITFDIISGDKKYLMKFNEFGALSEFVLNGTKQQILSTFDYNQYTSISAFHLELKNIVDLLTGGETKRIDWSSYGVPANQINEIYKTVNGTTYTYSTTIQYSYLESISNVHTNVNLFNLLTPEFLVHSNIPLELAATVSVFGTRSNLLPTNVTITEGRAETGENYVKLSEENREFTFDVDQNNFVKKIYTGSKANDNKALLYTIAYVGDKEDED